MAAPSIWSVSAMANQPESPYDSFLKNPRDRDGRLMLQNRSPEFQNSEDSLVFRSAWDK